MSSSSDLPILAFLGPKGTFSHQAAYDRFGSSVSYHPCSTISDVYNFVPPPSPSSSDQVPPAVLHLLPFENSKNGIVLETLDLLLAHSHSPDDAPKDGNGNGRVVVEELRTKVQHCLVVLGGEEGGESGLEGVEWVASHVQALAQCTNYLSTHLPNAKRISAPSTATAAVSLLPTSSPLDKPSSASASPSTVEGGEPSSGVDLMELPKEGRGAAICSKVASQLYDGLRLVEEGIEDKKGNTTRFLLLASPSTSIPSHPSAKSSPSDPSAPSSSSAPPQQPPPPPSFTHPLLQPAATATARSPPRYSTLLAFPSPPSSSSSNDDDLLSTLTQIAALASPPLSIVSLDRRPLVSREEEQEQEEEEEGGGGRGRDGGGFRSEYLCLVEGEVKITGEDVERVAAMRRRDGLRLLGSWEAWKE